MAMSLKAALARVQHTGGHFYLKVAETFSENPLMREAWITLSQDMELQAKSLEGMPSGFWKVLKPEEQAHLGVVKECSLGQLTETKEDRSLHNGLVRSLNLEEPLILRAYVPLIRLLRTEWSDRALDFYIIVRSHVTRISRMVQLFSIDPALLQRVQNLQQQFDYEVQTQPAQELALKRELSRKKNFSPARTHAVRKPKKARSSKLQLPLSERVQRIAKRAKPLVGKIEMTRRRARR